MFVWRKMQFCNLLRQAMRVVGMALFFFLSSCANDSFEEDKLRMADAIQEVFQCGIDEVQFVLLKGAIRTSHLQAFDDGSK